MKVQIDYIEDGENEIIIKCTEMNKEILKIMSLLDMTNRKISGYKDGELHLLETSQIYYFESVDKSVFAYTQDDIFRITTNLSELETIFEDFGFFRCSKSMIVNLNAISSLKSEMGNRINACLKNGEHIVISRHYAKRLRQIFQK